MFVTIEMNIMENKSKYLSSGSRIPGNFYFLFNFFSVNSVVSMHDFYN